MRSHKVVSAIGLLLIGAAVAVLVIFLRRQGLVQGSLWVTVVGTCVSTFLILASAVLAYLTWHEARRQTTAEVGQDETANVAYTGRVKQRNRNGVNIANSGMAGGLQLARSEKVTRTGSVNQANTGGTNVANSGNLGKIDLPNDTTAYPSNTSTRGE